MKNWYRKATVIEPAFHGTVYRFEPDAIRPGSQGVIFFTDDQTFARDYASQKSFDRKMDADTSVHSYRVEGEVFDPYDDAQRRQVADMLPETVTAYNDFGMSADLTPEKWCQLASGVITEPPKFTPQDLEGKRPGDPLPDHQVYQDPLSYELVRLDPDVVWYARAGTLGEMISGYGMAPYMYERFHKENPGLTKEQAADDLLNMDHTELMRKYWLFDRRAYGKQAYKASRTPTTTTGNDVWRWIEADGVLEAVAQAGYDIVRMRERGKDTYAALPSADITPI